MEENYLQDELSKERERFQAIVSLTSDLIFEYDIRKDEMRYTSDKYPKFQEGFCMPDYRNAVMSRNSVFPEDMAAFDYFYQELRGDKEYIQCELRTRTLDGTYRWVLIQGKRIHAEARSHLGERAGELVIGRISDTDAAKKEELRKAEEAKRDSLTKLYNKETAKCMISSYLREGENPSGFLMIVDIDRFKEINDRIGHMFGDTVLIKLSRGLKRLVGEDDILGRFGGDELILFCKGKASKEAVCKKAEEICALFVGLYNKKELLREITCSIGVACVPQDGDHLEELFVKADRAMHHAKQSEGNHFEIYSVTRTPNYAEIDSAGKLYTKDEILTQKRPDLIEEIAEFSFEILEGSEEIYGALSILLGNVGQRFNLSSIVVLGASMEKRTITKKYAWTKEHGDSSEPQDFCFTEAEWENIMDAFDKNGIYTCADTENLQKDGNLYYQIKDDGVRAQLFCSFYKNGCFEGGIVFQDRVDVRFWNSEEVRSLKMITRIIMTNISSALAFSKIEEQVEILTSYDEVSGLFKYDRFKEELKKLMTGPPAGKKIGVLYTDFSNFKFINEIYGYQVGDELLREFGYLIGGEHNKSTLAASRDYADNFISILYVDKPSEVISRIEQVNQEFIKAQNEKYPEGNMSAYTGFFLIKDLHMDVNIAIDNASLAKKYIKAKKTPGVCMYSPEMRRKMDEEKEFAGSFKRGIEEEEFKVYLQPKISLKDEALVGAEALVRWIRKDGTMVMPNDFIPTLEKNGNIVELDLYVFEKVVQMLKTWKEKGMKLFTISVNLSRIHVQYGSLTQKLLDIVKRYGVEEKYLELEITESAFIQNQEALLTAMEEIRDLGFGVSIDDFGSGYSSLKMLTQVPANVLKMDRDFLKNCEEYKRSRDVISYVIKLAKDIDMEVLCEGVETETQAEFLKQAGCDVAQGFFYARPMPVDEFENSWLK